MKRFDRIVSFYLRTFETCPLLPNPVKHLRPPRRQGATGATWSGSIATQMDDGGNSGGSHTAAAGVKCCRACTAAAPRSTVRFKVIEGPCAKAGTRYEGALTVHGPHANSRWLCDSHQQAVKRSASKGEAVIVDIITPSALPADRFCAVCARLLVAPLPGHGPGNINPDHRTAFFLRALR